MVTRREYWQLALRTAMAGTWGLARSVQFLGQVIVAAPLAFGFQLVFGVPPWTLPFICIVLAFSWRLLIRVPRELYSAEKARADALEKDASDAAGKFRPFEGHDHEIEIPMQALFVERKKSKVLKRGSIVAARFSLADAFIFLAERIIAGAADEGTLKFCFRAQVNRMLVEAEGHGQYNEFMYAEKDPFFDIKSQLYAAELFEFYNETKTRHHNLPHGVAATTQHDELRWRLTDAGRRAYAALRNRATKLGKWPGR
jgi:hypothetical protein